MKYMWTKIYTFEENSIMNKKLTLFALFLFACSIALGAFGAHALKKIVIEKWQVAFETAVKYQFYAALLLLILSFQPVFNQKPFTSWITLFLIGLGCFSGSIYGLVLAEITHVKLAFLGPITPIGGLLMIISVLMLGIKYSTNKSDL
jgi:uncharacterized membrane protein YgdD (TMEM256/DUF423 family)